MTKYRGFFEVTCDESGRFHKSFSSGDLIGKTKVICFIVTKEKIVNFFDKNFIGFYKNECVDFPEYAIIGCSSEETRHIYKFKYLTDTIPSICTIAEKKDIKEVSYDLSCESKIYIYLPPDEYSKYINLKGQLVRTKQALLFLNTLTTIIEKIKTGQGEDFISSEWYPVIESALFNIGVTEFTEDGMPESSYVYAQRILNNPIKDTFTEISSFVKDED
ncbi:MAG: hypothetical protein IJI14_16675 [Anaerolineaceae bacterium]|nr:hypothetical protein [Anaerolineaceae bacterium]